MQRFSIWAMLASLFLISPARADSIGLSEHLILPSYSVDTIIVDYYQQYALLIIQDNYLDDPWGTLSLADGTRYYGRAHFDMSLQIADGAEPTAASGTLLLDGYIADYSDPFADDPLFEGVLLVAELASSADARPYGLSGPSSFEPNRVELLFRVTGGAMAPLFTDLIGIDWTTRNEVFDFSQEFGFMDVDLVIASVIPIPAAVWLFGSGLGFVGLLGLGRWRTRSLMRGSRA